MSAEILNWKRSRDMVKQRTSRFLALDVRPRKFGYAAFETPIRLLDFGVTRFVSTEHGAGRIVCLLGAIRPTVLVLRRIVHRSRRNRRRTKEVLRIIRNEARRSSIQVVLVSEEELKGSFPQFAKRTKYHLAASLAISFPELAWRLPTERKPWETENCRMAIFEAVALGTAYAAREGQDDAESCRRPLGSV